MWPFKRKKKIVKEISGPAWGYLVNEHHIDVDILQNEFKCVEREVEKPGAGKLVHLRVFKLKDVAEKGIQITGWEAFDRHPDLIYFEGYVNKSSGDVQLMKRA